MWATTKYVSWTWASKAGTASIGPERPPMRNTTMNAIANSIGVVNRRRPPIIVKIQLKIFTPVGTAMMRVVPAKNGWLTAPVVNMWCAQVVTEYPAMARLARMNAVYPYMGFRENTGMISLTPPKNRRA